MRDKFLFHKSKEFIILIDEGHQENGKEKLLCLETKRDSQKEFKEKETQKPMSSATLITGEMQINTGKIRA